MCGHGVPAGGQLANAPGETKKNRGRRNAGHPDKTISMVALRQFARDDRVVTSARPD
jgi:hypothetical protein